MISKNLLILAVLLICLFHFSHTALTSPMKPLKPMKEVISSKSFGRYGWLTCPWEEPILSGEFDQSAYDGALSFTLAQDYSLKMSSRIFTLINRGDPINVKVTSCNWASKTVRFSFSDDPEYYITFGLLSPGVLIESRDTVLTIKSDGLTHIAFMKKDNPNPVNYSLLGFEYKKSRDGYLSENWILVWQDDGDVPLLIVLKKRPLKIINEEGSLRICFKDSLECAVVGNIYGVDGRPKALIRSGNGLSDEVIDKCRFWSRSFLSYPMYCHEYFQYDEANMRILIKDEYKYKVINDDWNTRPYKIAPIPPLVSFAKDQDYPVNLTTSPIIDYQYPTWYGPLRGSDNSNYVEYSLPIPPIQHLGLVKTPIDADHKWISDETNVIIANSLQYIYGGGRWDELTEPICLHPPPGKGNIDLYTWIGHFPSVLASLHFLDGSVKNQLLDALKDRLVAPLTQYASRIPAETREEPYTKAKYIVFFWANGFPGDQYWDADEAAGCTLQALYYYGLYSGDWNTLQKGWKIIKEIAKYFEVTNDWAYLASGCREYGMLTGYDMLSATYPGLLAYAKMARMIGDTYTYENALYMAARAAVPTVMRLKFRNYAMNYGLCGDDEYIVGFSEHGPVCHTDLDFQNVEYYDGCIPTRYLSSARGGTYIELINLYLTYAPQEILEWEQHIDDTYPEWYKSAFGIDDIDVRTALGENKADILEHLSQIVPAAETKWQVDWPGILIPHPTVAALSMDCPLLLTDSWAPCVFLYSNYEKKRFLLPFRPFSSDKIDLVFDVPQAQPRCLYSFQVGIKQNLRIEGFCRSSPNKITSTSIWARNNILTRVFSFNELININNSWYFKRNTDPYPGFNYWFNRTNTNAGFLYINTTIADETKFEIFF